MNRRKFEIHNWDKILDSIYHEFTLDIIDNLSTNWWNEAYAFYQISHGYYHIFVLYINTIYKFVCGFIRIIINKIEILNYCFIKHQLKIKQLKVKK